MFMDAMSDGKEEVDVNVVLVTWVSSANGLESDSKLLWISECMHALMAMCIPEWIDCCAHGVIAARLRKKLLHVLRLGRLITVEWRGRAHVGVR
jgi:hypothetical protein